MAKINFEIPQNLIDEFRLKCKGNGANMSDVLRKCIKFYNAGKLKIITEDRIEVSEAAK